MIPHLADATLTINLGAIEHNYHSLATLASSADCAAVVKADAYGLGMNAIAERLYESGCEHFFVAQLSEAITLRSILGNDAHIYVLHGVRQGQESLFVDANLIPILNHEKQVSGWNQHAKNLSTCLPAILHVDTGMNRLGLSIEEAAIIAQKHTALSHLDIRYVMSHLSCSGEPDNPMNALQLEQFNAIRALFPDIPATLCNSGGILLGKDYHFDLVRPGISLYGGYNHRPCPIYLEPVIRLTAKPLQIRTINSIETIGYGATQSLPKDTKIATIPVGYADGYLRALSNTSHLFYGEHKLPVVGRVSMDMITVDVSALGESITLQSEFELIGEHYAIDDVADTAGTIGYEILTRLGNRFHRHYIG